MSSCEVQGKTQKYWHFGSWLLHVSDLIKGELSVYLEVGFL